LTNGSRTHERRTTHARPCLSLRALSIPGQPPSPHPRHHYIDIDIDIEVCCIYIYINIYVCVYIEISICTIAAVPNCFLSKQRSFFALRRFTLDVCLGGQRSRLLCGPLQREPVAASRTGWGGRPIHDRWTRESFFIDNLLFRIHFIIVMVRWTGLASWETEFDAPRTVRAGRRFPCTTYWAV